MKEYKIYHGGCPNARATRIIKANSKEEAVRSFYKGTDKESDEKFIKEEIKNTREYVKEAKPKKQKLNPNNKITKEKGVYCVDINKELKPSKVLVCEKDKTYHDIDIEFTSLSVEVTINEKVETWVFGRGSDLFPKRYLEELEKSKQITTFNIGKDIDITIDQVCLRPEYVDYKKKRPEGKYAFIAYVIDTNVGKIYFDVFYDENIKSASIKGSKIIAKLGYKDVSPETVHWGNKYRTRKSEKLSKYYTAYDIKYGCCRI